MATTTARKTTRKPATEATAEPVSVTLALTKETPGTYRFDTDDDTAAIRTLYVRKSAFNGAAAPQSIVVTVASA